MNNYISFEEAKEIAWRQIVESCGRNKHDNPPMIFLEGIIDAGWAIIFPWNSKRAYEENDLRFNYVGNVPILVDLIDGTHSYFHSLMLAEDFSKFTALKNYAAQKGYLWDKSLEDYLNDQGLYPNSEAITPRKFPYRLIQYKPEKRKPGVFDFDKVKNVDMHIRYAIQMNSIEECKIKLEQEFSVSFEEKGSFYKGVYYPEYKTFFLESTIKLFFNYYEDEYEAKWFASEFKDLNIVFMLHVTTGKKEDRVETYKIIHNKLLMLGFVEALSMFSSID